MSEVNEKVKNGPLIMISDFPADEKAEPFKRALEDSINFKLMTAAAEDLEIEIEEADIEEQIDTLLKNQNANRTQLKEFLKQQGKSYEDYRKDFRNQILLRRFQGRVILPLVKITEEQIRSYYLEKSGRSADAATLDVKQILISVASESSENVLAAKKDLIEEAYRKIQGGMTFEEAAALYAGNGEATSMNGVKVNDLAPSIKASIEFLGKGEVSRPVKTTLGYHLFLVEDKKFSGDSSYLRQKRTLEYELRTRETTGQLRRWLESERQRRRVVIIN